MERLFVGVLGHRNSGKTKTWDTLFRRKVRTGTSPRTLRLNEGACAEVFLISGSPEERDLYAGDLLANQTCRIILCSMQYIDAVRGTLDYVVDEGFDFHVQWLNPGWKDEGYVPDSLGLMPWLLHHGATVAIRDGQAAPGPRVEEIRETVQGWAVARSLTFPCPARMK
jgi:hypothetical protein